jgi:23S rRNA (pseudouridine1915-N3)-methyltransferase
MKIIVTLFGKPKDKNILTIIAEYNKRISRYQDIELVYLKEFSTVDNLLTELNSKYKSNKIFLLDEDGIKFSTKKFSNLYEKSLESSFKHLIFCIGPSAGFGDLQSRETINKLKEVNANLEIISLGELVMQHDIAFLVLIEQLYRVVSIKKNLPYHKV